MKYKVFVTENFQKEAKKLLKKYASLKNELLELEKNLSAGLINGTAIGGKAYKIRLAVKSKNKGKSGGLRVITYIELDLIIREQTNVYLLSIYDKSETGNITKIELYRIISGIKLK
jgi:hypothetical protein